MKKWILGTTAVLVLSAGGFAIYSSLEGKACTGSKNCSACKNCSGCKHCKKDGGTCGVCR